MIATIIHDFQKNLISKKAYFNCLLHLPHKNNKGPTTINEQLITIETQFTLFCVCEVDTQYTCSHENYWTLNRIIAKT